MASKIRIKRSTGTTAPSSLLFGELGYTDGVGTHGNKGYRVFVGDAGVGKTAIAEGLAKRIVDGLSK